MAASKIQTGCQPEALIQIRLLPTAWLYSQFRAGTLTLDTGLGSYFDADRLANAGELQNAIGFLEDEGDRTMVMSRWLNPHWARIWPESRRTRTELMML
jgi:hypothetical protein